MHTITILCVTQRMFFLVATLTVTFSTTFIFHIYGYWRRTDQYLFVNVLLNKNKWYVVNFFPSRPSNSTAFWLILEVKCMFVNSSYLVCGLCQFSCRMSIICTFILKQLFVTQSLTGIPQVTIYKTLNI